eukprot:SAG11_NODE_2462_length_3327_cov_2.195167_3_plen_87_part_00
MPAASTRGGGLRSRFDTLARRSEQRESKATARIVANPCGIRMSLLSMLSRTLQGVPSLLALNGWQFVTTAAQPALLWGGVATHAYV